MTRDEILDTAKNLISGQRAQDYGDANDNFSRIAESWTWWLKTRLSSDITPNDVAMMMILLKMSRLINTPLHEDSYYDLCGYAALAGELVSDHGIQKEMEK